MIWKAIPTLPASYSFPPEFVPIQQVKTMNVTHDVLTQRENGAIPST